MTFLKTQHSYLRMSWFLRLLTVTMIQLKGGFNSAAELIATKMWSFNRKSGVEHFNSLITQILGCFQK